MKTKNFKCILLLVSRVKREPAYNCCADNFFGEINPFLTPFFENNLLSSIFSSGLNGPLLNIAK
jgi:hypothetical protein